MISIIIPVYNGENIIAGCLNSIFANKIETPFEVIIVDDGSTDRTEMAVRQFPCQYYKIEKSGAAAARNLGIKKAKGEIIFFFDADVKLKKDTLCGFLRHFENDKDAYIIQGRWDGDLQNQAFSPRLFLLKYAYSYLGLFKGRQRVEVANLETGCLAIRSEVFNHFSGFNEGYKCAGGEEHEFGRALLKKYKIFYYSDLFVEHEFGGFFRTLGKIYKRTINFSLILFKAKNDKDFLRLHKHTVPLYDRAGIVIIFLQVFSVILFFFNIKLALLTSAGLFIIYFLILFNFLNYLLTKENLFFTIKGAVVNYLLLFPKFLGLCNAFYIFYILREKDFKI